MILRFSTIVRFCKTCARPVRNPFSVSTVTAWRPSVSLSCSVEGNEVSADIPSINSKATIWRQWTNYVEKGDRTSSQKYLFDTLKLCLTPSIIESQDVVVEIATKAYTLLIEQGFQPTTDLYNLLLKIYIQNNHVMPSKFLELMKNGNCRPDRVTYELLMEAYGSVGTLAGIQKIKEFLQSKNMDIPKTIHAAMVTGHSRAGDLEAAKRILVDLEDGGGKVDSNVYTSLLMAYAERGLVEDIKMTVDKMTSRNICPDKETYWNIMKALSLSGHGSKVAEVLSLKDSKSWSVSDMYTFCCGCLFRGDLEACEPVLPFLAQMSALDDWVMGSFFACALRNGLTLEQTEKKALQYSNIDSIQWFPQIVTSAVLFSHFPENSRRGLPTLGRLVPHPWGPRWAPAMRECLHWLMDKKKLEDYHFFPLLARHCSDGDLKELVSTWYMMFEADTGMGQAVDDYVAKTFKNVGTTMRLFFGSTKSESRLKRLLKEGDGNWLGQLLIFQCAYGKWTGATRTVNEMSKEDILKYSEPLDKVLKKYDESDRTGGDCLSFVKALIKHGNMFANVLKHFYWTQGKLNMKMFELLLSEGIDISVNTIEFKSLQRLTKSKDVDAVQLWSLFKKMNYIPPGDVLVLLYGLCVKYAGATMSDIETASELYDVMSAKEKQTPHVQCQRVIHFTLLQKHRQALRLFRSLLSLNITVPAMIWKKMVVSAYLVDPYIGDEYLQFMGRQRLYPGINMLSILLHIHTVVYQDVVRAEGIFKLIKSNYERQRIKDKGTKWNMGKECRRMLILWAEQGNVEKIDELSNANLGHAGYFREARVLAHIYNSEEDRAFEELTKFHLVNLYFISVLMKAFVFKEMPLEKWMNVLMERGASENALDTLLFFTYIDCDLLDRARASLENLQVMDTEAVGLKKSSNNWWKYVKLLNQWNKLHLIGYNAESLKALGYTSDEDEEEDISGPGDIVATDSESVPKSEGFTVPEDYDEDRLDDMDGDNIDINERGENSGENLDMKKRKDDREMIDV